MIRPAVAILATLLALPCQAATRGPAADTVPLPPPVATPVDQPLQHQTGMVVLEGPNGERTIIRSLEPRSLVGGDRLDFSVLDADGDGLADRTEAAADRHLAAAFGSVDANGDGTLDRAELAGWIL